MGADNFCHNWSSGEYTRVPCKEDQDFKDPNSTWVFCIDPRGPVIDGKGPTVSFANVKFPIVPLADKRNSPVPWKAEDSRVPCADL